MPKNSAAKKPNGFEFSGGFNVGTMNAGEHAAAPTQTKKANKAARQQEEDDEEEEDEEGEDPENEDEDDEEGEEGDPLADLPPEVARRVKALRSMHDEMDKIQDDYRRERAELEKKFAAKRNDYYSSRKQIITGEKDVTPEEGAESAEDEVKGIPTFWCEVIASHPDLGSLISEDDYPALSALEDLRCVYSEDYKTFTLEFHFKENEFFSNTVLTKKYEVEPDLFEDAPGLSGCEGSVIDWKAGKNLCMAEIKKKQKAKSGRNKGQVRVVTRTVPKPSFFHFFKSPIEAMQEDEEQQDEEENEEDQDGPRTKFGVEEDYDIAHVLRTSIIPEAILYFTQEKDFGGMYDDEDDEDDEDEEGDEDEDEEDEDEEDGEDAPKQGKKTSKGKGGKAAAAGAAATGEKPQECKQN